LSNVDRRLVNSTKTVRAQASIDAQRSGPRQPALPVPWVPGMLPEAADDAVLPVFKTRRMLQC
jgi:hypothetical protein